MNTERMNAPLIRTPSAWLPIVMSLAAASLVWVHVARFGVTHETDEGTSAHLYQLLVALQVPVVLFFAARWLPRRAKEATFVLGLQGLALFFAFASLYWFEHGR